jgi:hypothetical protein
LAASSYIEVARSGHETPAILALIDTYWWAAVSLGCSTG